MEKIELKKLATEMLSGFKKHFEANWREVQPFAEKETISYVQNLQLIERMKQSGEISEEQAKLHIEIQKSSMRVVLLSIKGISIVELESAINEAISLIKDVVNKAIGWNVL